MWQAIKIFFSTSLGNSGTLTAIKVWQLALAATVISAGAVGTYTYFHLATSNNLSQHVLVFVSGMNTDMKNCQTDTFDNLIYALVNDTGVTGPYSGGCNAANQSYLQSSTSMAFFSYTGGKMDAQHGVWLPNNYAKCEADDGRLQQDVQAIDTMLDSYLRVFPHATFTIVGHSLGGLVALQGAYDYTVKHHNSSIGKVITIDSPLEGVFTTQQSDYWVHAFSNGCTVLTYSGGVVTKDLLPLGKVSFVSPVCTSQQQETLSQCKARALVRAGVGVITLGNQKDSLFCQSFASLLGKTCETQVLLSEASTLKNFYDLPSSNLIAPGHGTILSTPSAEQDIIRYILAPVVTINQPTLQNSGLVSTAGIALPFFATVRCLWGPANHATAQVMLKDGKTLLAGTAVPTDRSDTLVIKGVVYLSSSLKNSMGMFYIEARGNACQYPSGGAPHINAKVVPTDTDYLGGKATGMPFTLTSSAPSTQIYGSTSPSQTITSTDGANLLVRSTDLTVSAGQSFSVYFDYENIGNTTWSDTSNYQLICNKNSIPNANCMGGTTQGLNGVQIPPGYQATFYLTLTAPNTPGTYQLNWLMARNGMSLGQNQGSVVVKVAIPVTISMPPTQTSCPTPGTARAMISRPLAQGNDQNIVFINNESSFAAFERYDVNEHRATHILQLDNQVINSAQISPDGKWLLFITNVASGQLALQMVRMDGQGLQTLYCSSDISYAMFSPDQHWLALDTSSPSSASLTMTFIHTSDGALYMQNLQPNDQFTMFSPFTWIDNTHFYILSSYLYLHHSIYQMYNLSLAHPQQITFNSIPGLKVTGNWIISDFALSQDSRM